MFNDSIKNTFTLKFDSWTTDRKTVDRGGEYQLDIGSSSNINCPKCLLAAHQAKARSGPANKTNIIGNFDHFNIRNFFVEISGVRYPKDTIDLDYEKRNHLYQYRDLKFF